MKPLHITNIAAPADGYIVEKNFKYGQQLKQGKTLVKLNSNKLVSDYNQALANYLTAKEKFSRSQAKLKGSKKLWQMGIISRNEYDEDNSTVQNDHLSFLQALYALENTTTTAESPFEDLKSLSLSDISKIEQVIKLRYNYLNVVASKDGIALLPPQASSDKKEAISVGSQIKLGQVIVSIGDLSGVSAEIEIAEVNVDKIKPGQKVSITGVAFPKQVLHGFIKSIDSQATQNGAASSGLPTFSASVILTKLTHTIANESHCP